MRSSLITGLAGTRLSPDERAFLADVRPAGIILFTRNCESHEQIRALIAEASSAVGVDDLIVAIDQEGGRVQRLRPPLGRALPPARAFGAMFEAGGPAERSARCVFRLLAEDLRALGINCDCAPVLDLPVAGADGIIGDRAFGERADVVIALGRSVAEGLMDGGVVPVIKHIPGHGRATCDSHLALPKVDTSLADLDSRDFGPFRALHDIPAAMTAHVVYRSLDADRPVTTSPAAIAYLRDDIGFRGLLMSDDLSMKALSGPMRARAEATLAAGCDVVLHCNGAFAEMTAVAEGVGPLAGEARERFDGAMSVTRRSADFDRDEAEAHLAEVFAAYSA